LKAAEGLAPLIALLSDSEEPLRITAILTLGRYNHPQAVAALIRLFDDEHVRIRHTAASALTPESRALALPLLLDILETPTQPTHIRATAAWALHEIKDAVVPQTLNRLLTTPLEPEVQRLVINSLGYTFNDESTPLLLECLKHPDPDIRWHTVLALGRIGDPSSAEALLKVLEDPHPDVRKHAASVLERFSSLATIKALTTALNDSSVDVRVNAAVSLGRLKATSASPDLQHLFEERLYEVHMLRRVLRDLQ
jgi:HEAT repeat protein